MSNLSTTRGREGWDDNPPEPDCSGDCCEYCGVEFKPGECAFADGEYLVHKECINNHIGETLNDLEESVIFQMRRITPVTV